MVCNLGIRPTQPSILIGIECEMSSFKGQAAALLFVLSRRFGAILAMSRTLTWYTISVYEDANTPTWDKTMIEELSVQV